MSVRNLTIAAGSVAAAFILLFLALGLYFQNGLGGYADLSESASRLASSLEKSALLVDGPYTETELTQEISRNDRLFESVLGDLSSPWISRDKDPVLASSLSRIRAGWKEARSKLRQGYHGRDKDLKNRLINLSREVLGLSPLISEDTRTLAEWEKKALVIFSMLSIGGVWYAALFMLWRILEPIEEITQEAAETEPRDPYETVPAGTYSEIWALAGRYESLAADLNESRAHYSDLVNAIPDALAETDEHGNITFVNEAVTALTGHSRKDLIGTDHAAFIPQSAAAGMREIFDAVMKGGTLINRELPIILKDGGTRYFEFSISPIRRADGKVAGCRFVGRDIDERKRIMDELKRTREESKEASEKLKKTIEDLEEFSLLAVRRELKMLEIRERFKKLMDERRG
jgi:PAS domain S-box-containing protein